MKSFWKFWCDARKAKGASTLLARLKRELQAETLDESIEPYHKGGHVVTFSVSHSTNDWEKFVFQVIELGQRVAYQWTLMGDVSEQPEGWSNHARHAGIQSIQWQCDRNTPS